MRSLKLAVVGLFLSTGAAFAGVPSVPVAPPGHYYFEGADAPSLSGGPQLLNNDGLTTSPWSGIAGSLGNCNTEDIVDGVPVCVDKDLEDTFSFYFAGGLFQMHFVIGSPLSPSDVTRNLYSSTGLVTPVGVDDWGFQAAGNYTFELIANIPTEDPPYFAALFDLNPDRIPLLLDVPQAAPAPGALALLLAGLAGLGFSRRRARAA